MDLIADHLGLGLLIKNTESKENEFMTGLCDVKLPDMIIDAKSSWDVFTFPYFAKEVPDPEYITQLQVYMHLYDKPKAILAYCLVDAPQHLIEREAMFHCRNMGYEDLDAEIYAQFEAKMTYGDIALEYKVKIFEIERDDTIISAIEDRVKEAREYIATLIETIKP